MELELLNLRVIIIDDAEDSSVVVAAQKHPVVAKKSLLVDLNAKYDCNTDAHIQRDGRRHQSVPNINTGHSISMSRAESWVAQCRKSNWTFDGVGDFSSADTTSLSTILRPNAVSVISHIDEKDKCSEY